MSKFAIGEKVDNADHEVGTVIAVFPTVEGKHRLASLFWSNFYFWIYFPAPLGQRYLFNVVIDVPMFHGSPPALR